MKLKSPTKKQIQNFWSATARSIEEQIERHPPGTVPVVEKIMERVIYEACLDENTIVLDLGCGVGMQSVAIAKQGPFVIGLDISLSKIKAAKMTRDYFALIDNINFIVADMSTLPLKQNSFDLAVSFAVFQHLSEPFEIVEQINKILTPKGKLIIQVPNKLSPWYFFVRPFLAKFLQKFRRNWIIDRKVHARYLFSLLRKAGFSKTKAQYFGFLPPGHKNPRYKIIYRAIDDTFERLPLINYLGGVLIITSIKSP